MHFILYWQIAPGVRKQAISRFMETGGMPPEGVKMVTRWHTTDGAYGFAVAETDDAQALAEWSLAWNDLLTMEVRPAVDDENMGAVLAKL